MNTKRKSGRSHNGPATAKGDLFLICRVDEATHRWFKAYAQTQNRSVSKQMRTLIQEVMEQEKAPLEEEAA